MGKQTDKKPRKVLSINRGKHSPRLFSKGVFIGYTRNLANTKCNNHLLQLEGVQDPEAAKFYLGKRVMYLYSAKKNHAKKSYRAIWGKICRAHGNSGLVRAKFRVNLPGQALGRPVRVMLYPSNV